MQRQAHVGPEPAVTGYLEILPCGALPARVVPFQDDVVIGRESPLPSVAAGAGDTFLCIPEHTVSRRHARIRRRGNVCLVEDLHSVNGTFVDGQRLPAGGMQALREGDEIGVASVRMRFHSLLVSPPEPAPAIITKVVDATEYTRMQDLPGLPAAPHASADDLKRTVQKLHAMAQVGIALGVVRDRATLIEKVMKFIFELFPLAERAFILLRDSAAHAAQVGPDGVTPDAARRRDGMPIDASTIRMSRTILRDVLERRQAILSVDTLSDRHFGEQESIVAQPIRSVMCVPLLLEQECLGLIQVDTSSDPHAFQEQDLEMLTGVCAEAAVTLKTFQLYADIERLLDGFVHASVQAIEERDPVTAGHSFRVAETALRLAQAVGRAATPRLREAAFSSDQLREIRYAALLHDFGKVGVREHVLRKEKKLHHADMRLLEQRFQTARACIERQAWRQLVESHSRAALSMADFAREKSRIEQALAAEAQKMTGFLDAIRRANEPAISATPVTSVMPGTSSIGGVHPGSRPAVVAAASAAGAAELDAILARRFEDLDGRAAPLLEEAEFLALSVAKGCLTPQERLQIESHVADSYAFLVLIPWTRDLASVPAIAHGHHEKLDGSGYPRGLRGAEISLQTRILTICDMFDALTAADRPYKKAVPVVQALDLLGIECRSGRLDADLFDVFVTARVWEGD